MTTDDGRLRWVLTLYVNGASTYSASALETVRRICDEELNGQVELQVVDAHHDPARLAADDVLALPTLIKRLPPPLRHLVGDLASTDRVRVGLDLGPAADRRPDRERPSLEP